MLSVRPVFYASYRDIYDALLSSKQRVGMEFLLDFLRARGIVYSPSSSRIELIEAIASYAYESADLDEICDQLEIHPRPDRKAHFEINQPVQDEVIAAALEAVKKARSETSEVYSPLPSADGRLGITVDYYEFDEGRTLLRQQRPKQDVIEIMKVPTGIRLRFPGNARLTDIANSVIEEIQKTLPTAKKNSIDLGAFTKIQRTEFFQLMIQRIEGYKMLDVKKVNVHQDIDGIDFSESDVETLEEEDEKKDAAHAEKAAVEKEVKYYLKKCSLDGRGIMHAKELKRFLESGFFISRIVWHCQPTSKAQKKSQAELEAVLQNAAAGQGFEYHVRAIYPLKRNKKYATTKKVPGHIEREDFLEKIEKAAQAAYAEVLAKIESGVKGGKI